MNENNSKNSQSPLDELDGFLKQAVAKIQAEPIPQAALHRALERAEGIEPEARPFWHWSRIPSWQFVRTRFLVLAGAAALFLMCLWLIEDRGRQNPSDQQVASANNFLTDAEIKAEAEVGRPGVPPPGFRYFDKNPKNWVPNMRNIFTDPSSEPVIETEATRIYKDGQMIPSRDGFGVIGGSPGSPQTTSPPRPSLARDEARPDVDPNQFGAAGGGESFARATPNVIGDGGVTGSEQAAIVTKRISSLKLSENERPRPGASDRVFIDYKLHEVEKLIRGERINRAHNENEEEIDVIKNGGVGLKTQGGIVDREALKKLKKLRELTSSWADLPEKDRAEALAKLTKDLPQGQREAIEQYFQKLGETGKDKKPQVWQRDKQRPAFARVYVGNGNSLELVSLQVTTTIEGPRARTVVDHIFRNPHDRQLEGTFEYPLPTGASASYFAMFLGQTRDTVPERFARRGVVPEIGGTQGAQGTQGANAPRSESLDRLTPEQLVKNVDTADWGTLREARIVSKEKALETYEQVVRGKIDPALLEYSGGNTFQGRVYPIPPRGYNRVLIAYEELLPVTGRGVQYRFALPDCKLAEMQFTLNAAAAECREADFRPGEAKKQAGGGRLSYSQTWKDKGPGGDVLFTFTPPDPRVQVSSGRQGESGPLYLYARVRPDLPVEGEKPFAEHAVFLLDTSLSEHPDRFDVNMKLLRRILESDPAIKHFNILTFDVAARWLEPKAWFPNTEAGRAQAFERLDGIVLEGATNLSAALDKVAGMENKSPVNVFLLSDGQITWGEPDAKTLAARFESRCPFPVRFHCYRSGIGAENQELFETLVRRGGGVFNCYSEADLKAAAAAHRQHCFQVERVILTEGPETSDLLVSGRKSAIYPGGELIVAARAQKTGRVQLVLEGVFQGKPMKQQFPVEIAGSGELAPRGWGEIAVASLLALNDPKLDDLITAYCQQFGVGSRVASFLVLENTDDYKRLNLEAERGRTVPGGDLSSFLNETWRTLGQAQSPRAAFERLLGKIETRLNLKNGDSHVQQMLAQLGDKDFEIDETSAGALEGKLLHKADVPPAYLATRERDRRDLAAVIAEARRRADADDAAGAVRALSSVIEEYPSRADALRLVGYRLLDLKQPAQAARLFRQVLQARPFEPHSYRDLARSLEDSGKFALAALQYEIVLAGAWDNRFRDSLKLVAQEEYVRMMRQAIQQQAVSKKMADGFGERLEQLYKTNVQSDLRVTISWNTDATDVDLWVIEPDGTKCFYSHSKTRNGGELSQDQTQGYGPERYQIAKAPPGEYTVIVHYFGVNANLLAGETHVNVAVTRNAGTPQEVSQRYNVILKKHDEQVEVCRVKF